MFNIHSLITGNKISLPSEAVTTYTSLAPVLMTSVNWPSSSPLSLITLDPN